MRCSDEDERALRDMNYWRIMNDPLLHKDAENAADYLKTLPCLCGLEHIPLRRVHSSPGRLDREEGLVSWPGLEVPEVQLHPFYAWKMPVVLARYTLRQKLALQEAELEWCAEVDLKIEDQSNARAVNERLLMEQSIEVSRRRLEEIQQGHSRQPAPQQVCSRSVSPKKIRKTCPTCHHKVPFTNYRKPDLVELSTDEEEVEEVAHVSSEEDVTCVQHRSLLDFFGQVSDEADSDVESLTGRLQASSIEDESPAERRLVNLAVEMFEDPIVTQEDPTLAWNYNRWG